MWWCDTDQVCHPLDAGDSPRGVLGRHSLIMKLHGALERDPSMGHNNPHSPSWHRSVPVQGVHSCASDLSIAELAIAGKFHYDFIGDRFYSRDSLRSLFGGPFLWKVLYGSAKRYDAGFGGYANLCCIHAWFPYEFFHNGALQFTVCLHVSPSLPGQGRMQSIVCKASPPARQPALTSIRVVFAGFPFGNCISSMPFFSFACAFDASTSAGSSTMRRISLAQCS